MGDNIYVTFWNTKINQIIDEFKSGKTSFSIDVKGLEQFGDRESYYSKFRIIKGQLDIARNAYAQGRDFYQVLSNTSYFKEQLTDRNIAVTISKELKLYIDMNDVNAPEFFTQNDFDQLSKYVGKKLDRSQADMVACYDYLTTTYYKVEYWAQQVVKKIFPDGVYSIIKKPTNQAGIFEYYHWAKLYPNRSLLEAKHLAFTLTISTDDEFCVKIDTVALSDGNPIRQRYEEVRGNFHNSPIVKIFPKEDVLSKSWEELIDISVKAIQSLEQEYYKLLEDFKIYQNKNIEHNESETTINTPLNIILYGPPGTGKTYKSIDEAVKIATGKSGEHKDNKRVFDDLRKEGQIEFVTFHQNYTYEDFMIGLKPDHENATLRFVPYKGVFYQLCKRARENYEAAKENKKVRSFEDLVNELLGNISEENPVEFKTTTGKPFWLTDFTDRTIYFKKSNGSEKHSLSISTLIEIADYKREINSGLNVYYHPIIQQLEKKREITGVKENLKNFVLVIDEINRANISKVFGELITLLEDDKRLGGDNELRVTLPNGEKDFALPPNLYILGTMNTADKSIALIDIALRRRFEFIGKYPDYSQVKDADKRNILEKINKIIYSKRNSADYLVGHAYFMKDEPIDIILRNKVIPLLMEYFSGKTEIVTEVFKDTKLEVKYNTDLFSWDIKPQSNAVAV